MYDWLEWFWGGFGELRNGLPEPIPIPILLEIDLERFIWLMIFVS